MSAQEKLNRLKKWAIRIARELHYKAKYMLRIQNATTESEVYAALSAARNDASYCVAK